VNCVSGKAFGYDHLILATGVRNRLLQLPGLSPEAASHIFYLRGHLDADQIKQRVKDAKNVVVIGAGFIGLEFAAVAAGFGLGVNVLDVAPRPMARAVTEDISAYFLDLHRANGVNVFCGVTGFKVREDSGRMVGVELADGQILPADFLMVGIGVIPNTELAEQAGLEVGNGIVVDEFLSTADEAISAIGDCCVFPSPFADGLIRLESVQNAVDQARIVAAKIMGKLQAYTSAPWFWSDQYATKLQIVGLAQGCDETVIAGDIAQHKFSVFCFRQQKLIGIESINMPSDHMAGRKLWKADIPLRPDDVRASGFSLKAYEAALRATEKA
jgi:3-phenylpropionate/trans-cinnamate dioxygenase ferredoxin reductase subunit